MMFIKHFAKVKLTEITYQYIIYIYLLFRDRPELPGIEYFKYWGFCRYSLNRINTLLTTYLGLEQNYLELSSLNSGGSTDIPEIFTICSSHLLQKTPGKIFFF